MNKSTSAALLATLFGSLTFAPAALAELPQAEQDQPGQAETAPAEIVQGRAEGDRPMGAGTSHQGMKSSQGMMMTASGPSVPFLVHHAYKEALHAQESVTMGMNAMATNHLENVGLVLGTIDLGRDVSDANLRTGLTQIRDQARSLGSAPSIQGSQQLVGRFVNLVATMPMPAMGGGGGGMMPLTPMLNLPGELAASAAMSAANAQVDASQRNFDGAKRHAQHAVAGLEQALASARLHQMPGDKISQIQTLHNQANEVLSLVGQRSTRSVQASGQLVTRISSALPTLAPVHKAGSTP